MTSQTLEQTSRSPDASLTAVPSTPSPRRESDPLWMRAVLFCAIAIYIATLGNWAYWKGMNLRMDIWENTRTIRFHGERHQLGFTGPPHRRTPA